MAPKTSGRGKGSGEESKGGKSKGKASYKENEDGGDGARRNKGKGSKGGKEGYGDDGNYNRGGKGNSDDQQDSRGPGRSQLSSAAPDFTPSGMYFSPQVVAPMPPLWKEYTDPEGQKYYYNSKTGLTQWERPPELDPMPPPKPKEDFGADKADKAMGGGGRRNDQGRSGGDGDRDADRRGGRRDGGGGGDRQDGKQQNRRGGKRPDDKAKRGGGKQEQDASEFGPPGCNLFVFHLPDDWTDDDLHEYFAPHGNVVSAKVMKELGTGRSRGFGFVSYEDRVSAATAIKKMQGYKILGKRLKVEFKKGEGQDLGEDGDGIDYGKGDEQAGAGAKKSYPDDERLIGYLRAISAKNVVQSLKESEGAGPSPDAQDEGEDDDVPIAVEQED